MFENCVKSKYSMGYDSKYKEEATIAIMERIKEALLDGRTKYTISQYLASEMGIKTIYARALCSKVWADLSREGTERKDGMLEKNLQRLERIYERAMDSNDLKQAISALDQINKLCKLYTSKIEVTTDEYYLDLLGDGSGNDDGAKEENTNQST